MHRPIRNARSTWFLPYAAGGGTDTIARVFAKAMAEDLKGSIVVENKAGAGGNLATDAVAAAKPDGYTLLIGNQGPMAVNPHLLKGMRNDPATTLEPIGLIAEASLVLVVGPRMKVSTVAEFIEAAKKTQLSYGSASNASASHLAALLLQRAAGFKALHVPYRGAAPALNDLVGGHVDFMVTTIPSVTGLIESKQLKGLMVTGNSRAEVLPDIPTPCRGGVAELSGGRLVCAPGTEGASARSLAEAPDLDVRGAFECRAARPSQGRRRLPLGPARPGLRRLHGRRPQALGRHRARGKPYPA